MNNDDLYQKGMEIRRTLHGEASFKKSNTVTYGDPLMTNFIKVATTSVFGALWARPGLDLKTRALVVMISDACTGQEAELHIHMIFALKQGWTKEEISEVLLQLMGYIGAPKIREAMLIAVKVFAEYEAGLKGAKKTPKKAAKKTAKRAAKKTAKKAAK
jgi:4-carboxymuconolactone decarboxylase